MFKRILAILSVVFILCGAAFAEDLVTADSGNSNVRTSPNLDADSIGVLHQGESAPYAGSTSTDDRGVDWYSISYDGETGWVSSRYTVLTIDGEAVSEEKPADDEVLTGSYTGIYGYTCKLSDSPAQISIYEPDGSLLLSCPYSPVKDSEGFVSVHTTAGFDLYPGTCNGDGSILLYSDDSFLDMLILDDPN